MAMKQAVKNTLDIKFRVSRNEDIKIQDSPETRCCPELKNLS
jgi:hypothetical protein